MSQLSLYSFVYSLTTKKSLISLGATLVFIFGAVFCSVALPILLKNIVDQLAVIPQFHIISVLFISYALILFLQRFFSEMQFLVYTAWEQTIIKNTYNRIADVLFKNQPAFFQQFLPGAISSKIAQAVTGLDLLMFDLLFKILPIILEYTLIIFSMTMLFNFKCAVLIAIGIMVYLFIMKWVNKKLLHIQNNLRAKFINAQGVTTDIIQAWKDIKLTNSLEFASSLLKQTNQPLWLLNRSFYKQRSIYGFLQALPICVIFLLVNYYTIISYTFGACTLGTILLVNNYLLQLLKPIESLSLVVRSVAKNYSDFSVIKALINYPQEKYSTQQIKFEFKSLQLKNVCVEKTLKEINLKINRGDKIAIIGASGAGKTTLLNIIAGLHPNYSGDIYLNQQNIKEIPVDVIRHTISFLSSDARLFKGRLFDNIYLAKKMVMTDPFAQFSLSDKINNLPEGIHSIITEGLFSAGEAQRLKLLRTSLLKAQVEIYDESTSALNYELEKQIIENLLNQSDKTILFVTHKTNFLTKFDRVYQIKNGALINYTEEYVHA